jgi:putative ABC transport system permease protein
MSGLLQDVRYAMRQLRKSPGFTTAAVLTLALGIGATTTIFSILNSLLLRPLPYPNSLRIVRVWNTFLPRGMKEIPASEPEFNEYRQSQSFTHLAAFSTGARTLTGMGTPLRLDASWVTPDFFSALGTQPFLGRVFLPDDYQQGQAHVAILSFRLWQGALNANPNVIGESISLNGEKCTVVGVMPRSFAFPSQDTSVWQPLAISPASANLGNHYLYLVGDLKPRVTAEEATAEINTIFRRIQHKYASYYAGAVGIGVSLVPLREQMVGTVRPIVLILMAGVGLMLLISCTNVASLFLARAQRRKSEIATKIALGATHGRIVRQLLADSLLLFIAGGTVGTLIAFLSAGLLSSQNYLETRRVGGVTVDTRVLAFAAGISVLTGLFFGLMPAFKASHVNSSDVLNAGSRDPIGGRYKRSRAALVSSEIALSLVLLSGAGLMITSLVHLLGVNLGFNPENVETMRLSLPQANYPLAPSINFYKELLDHVRHLHGVQAVAVVNQLPMSDVMATASFEVEGRLPKSDVNVADTDIISPDYFRVMGMPLLRGRPLTEQDAAYPVSVVVNQTLARKVWPGTNPIGKRIRLRTDAPWLTVVGVVDDIKDRAPNADTRPEIYSLHTDYPIGLWADLRTMTLVIRTTSNPDQIIGAIREQVRDLDPVLPVYEIAALQQIVSSSLSQTRFPAFVLSAFAVLSLILAAIGIYGVLAYIVAQRSHEIGLRMALGATRGNILKLFLQQALGWAALGSGIGIVTALMLVRFLRSVLFQVSPYDPAVLVVVVVLLTAIATIAGYVPARRAATVDPMVALRYE